MSLAYSYEILLKASYTQRNITHLLAKGAKLNFKYYSIDGLKEFSTIDQAVTALMTMNVYGAYSILAKINGNLVTIASAPSEAELAEIGLIIGDFYDVDAIKYMQLLVNLIRDFALLDIQIIVE